MNNKRRADEAQPGSQSNDQKRAKIYPQQREDLIRDWLMGALAAALGLSQDKLDINEPFVSYGLESIDAVSLSGDLEEWLGRELPPTLLYDYPTIKALAHHLSVQTAIEQQGTSASVPPPATTSQLASETEHNDTQAEPIAIIGIGCRFPGGGDSPEAFWQFLRSSGDAIVDVPTDRWDSDEYYDADPDAPGKMYTRKGGFLHDISGFDADFFGISPREAMRMDPQQRLLSEVTWEALEHAGLPVETLAGSQTGVFIGMMNGLEYLQLQTQTDDISYLDDPYLSIGSASSIAAGRLAYHFDWHGPTLTVDTACSSSLVALHLACQSLRNSECDLAVVGGVNAILLPDSMVNACKMRMLSVNGPCRTFDATADGFALGEGCGVVVLKRLSTALADQNEIIAVVRGSAVNQDGRSNGITAPNKLAQEAVIRRALESAKIEPEQVDYIEAHGSGTALGDPIEINALMGVFSQGRTAANPLLVGTVKTNVGHLAGAAGIAGLIKTALALKHQEIPPHLHLENPNPYIAWQELPVHIPGQLQHWSTEAEKRIAGVSSFGWSGTNAHVILEEAPAIVPANSETEPRHPYHVLVLSAKTETALEKTTDRLVAYLRQHPGTPLSQVAYTLQQRRSRLSHRRIAVCQQNDDAIEILATRNPQQVISRVEPQTERQVAFLLPGVGEQYPGMAQELYAQEPFFRQTVDECLSMLEPLMASDLRILLLSSTASAENAARTVELRALLGRGSSTNSDPFTDTALAQPAIFVVEYALARLWQQWGVQPQALLGYSLGEYVVACLAGVFSLKDALTLVVKRSQLIAQLPAGVMLAVALSEEEVQAYVGGDISLAIINAPTTCVLAGTQEGIVAVEQRLEEDGVVYRRVASSHAFHSSLLEPVRHELEDLVKQIHLQVPQIPYLSNVTGDWILPEEATDASYWGRHMCETVQFAQGVEHLLHESEAVLLEVGIGQGLGSFVRQHPACSRERMAQVVSSLPGRYERESGQAAMLRALGTLWLAGVTISWRRILQSEQPPQVSLPTYPFEHKQYWIQRTQQARQQSNASNQGKKAQIADWFYQPVWKQVPLKSTIKSTAVSATSPAINLIFMDDFGIGEQVVEQQAKLGNTSVTVRWGIQWKQIGPRSFQMRAGEAADYQQLMQVLKEKRLWPTQIFHCWSLTTPEESDEGRGFFSEMQDCGLYSLLFLTQALDQQIYDGRIQLWIISNNVQAVTGQETLYPEKAPILAACKVIPQEHPQISCSLLDLGIVPDTTWSDPALIEQVCAECIAHTDAVDNEFVAYREGKRWVKSYQRLSLQPASPEKPSFRQQGVYLITGGLGAVGLVLAQHLARTAHARLILTTRSPFPAREEWDAWLTTHDSEEEISCKIQQLYTIEEAGGEVLVLRANVANQTQMQSVIEHIYHKYTVLHGVFHAAGNTSPQIFRPIQAMGIPECEAHFQAKVYGLMTLEQVLEGKEIDFCLIFSSISALLGGLGFIGYAAANAFMDVYTAKHNQASVAQQWTCVNWDTWQVGSGKEQSLAMRASVATYAMTGQEGLEALTRILVHPQYRQIVNSTGDLYARLQRYVQIDVPSPNVEQLKQPQSANRTSARHAVNDTSLREEYERIISEIWQDALGVSEVSLYDNFFDMGGNSLIGMQVIAKLKKALQKPIPAVALFEAPTISTLIKYLLPQEEVQQPSDQKSVLAERRNQARQVSGSRDIAIIGMTGRFPGALTVEQFWENLRNGVESISTFTDEELVAAGVDPELLQRPNYVKARPILPAGEVEHFDAAFFGYSPREAELTDPQHRLFLECSWEALEQAGYDPTTYDGLIGVYAGNNLSTHLLSLMRADALPAMDDYQMVIGHDKDSLTTMVSYKLNLKGPSFAVQTFCSTSLVATHLACQSLLTGESDMTLAGGISIRVPEKAGYLYQEGGMESPDGHCRTFDVDARGSLFGDGVAVIVLKRLADALADGDTIHSIIKGSAINNDGSLKVSYTAPSVVGQSEVVSMALASANIHPETISYIEAHGTATELGDPIEMASLIKAYRVHTEETGYCAVGSVKTNVGHLDRAAGLAGLIKTVQALKHKEIPPSLHFKEANPEIDFVHSPFYVNTQLALWPERLDTPRRAGINSLGMGGTNAHVILEEPPALPESGPSRPWQLLVLSARTAAALETMTTNMRDYLQQHDDVNLADVAHTLRVGRRRFEQRRFLVCRNREEAIQSLSDPIPPQVVSRVETQIERQVAFLLPGVGEQYPGMVQELYAQEPVFQQTIDECLRLLAPLMPTDLRSVLLSPKPSSAMSTTRGVRSMELQALLNRGGNGRASVSNPLDDTALAQPAIFIVEYALALLWLSWGIQPQALLGYSLGEYVVACLAGVFSLQDALTLVARRAQLIAQLPAGVMLAVALSELEVQTYLGNGVSLAIINAPTTCVLAGTPEGIVALELRLDEDCIAYRRVVSSHAFHTSLLEPVRAELEGLVRQMRLQPPTIPYISNVSGTWIRPEEATDAAYWGRHMCETVRFAQGIEHLLRESDAVLLEVGIGQGLSSFVRQHPACSRERMAQVIPGLPGRYERESEQAAMLRMLGTLWLAGVAIPWQSFSQPEQRYRIPLPTYPFERQRYWIDLKEDMHTSSGSGKHKREAKADLNDWFYQPVWQQVVRQSQQVHSRGLLEQQHCWLIFTNNDAFTPALITSLKDYGQQVIQITQGEGFSQRGEHAYTIHPTARADYELLLKTLRNQGMSPDRVIHLWSVAHPSSSINATDSTESMLNSGFYSLLCLAQGLADSGTESCRIVVVTNAMHDVTGYEQPDTAQATIAGLCKVIGQEYSTLDCQHIDIDLSSVRSEQMLGDQFIAELMETPFEREIALRGHHRWKRVYEPLKLAETNEVPLRPHGVYLITGGLGGIGLAMADYLAEVVEARIVLISRSGLPPREQWSDILQERQDDQSISRQIRQILQLQEKGAEVLILAADVSNEAQMSTAIKQTISTFGDLHGVLHTAGLPGAGLMQLKTAQMAANVLAPKVQGTLVLERVLRDYTLDFVVLFSSITAVTGGPGQADYCAANAFLDAYARHNSMRHKQVVSIAWSEWQWNAWESGLDGFGEATRNFFKKNRAQFGITFTEGAEVLRRVLAHRLQHVVVSPQNFQSLIDLGQSMTITSLLEQEQGGQQQHGTHERPVLSNSYVAPRNAIERDVATVWEGLLGITGIGIHDNFFDLGGNSLIGLELITRLRKAFQRETIQSYVLYEAPSVSAMAQYLQETKEAVSIEGLNERSEKRKANLKKRMSERAR